MGIADIRKKHGITCKVGQRVRYSPPGQEPRHGVIVGTKNSHLRIKLYPRLGEREHVRSFHPTWCLEFLGD